MDSFFPSGYDTSELNRCETDEMAVDCMGVWMRMANRIVTAIYDEALSDLGLKGSQLNLLVAVFREGTIRQTDLATLFNIDETTLSRNVMRMCRKRMARTAAE
jgi:DNA-binding MarR family transcriptional regulator